jgi:hypothetical protein
VIATIPDRDIVPFAIQKKDHMQNEKTKQAKVTLKGASTKTPSKVIVKTNVRAGAGFHRLW